MIRLGRRTPQSAVEFIFIGRGRRTFFKSGYKRTLQLRSNLIRITKDHTSLTSQPDRSDLRHCQFWLPTHRESRLKRTEKPHIFFYIVSSKEKLVRHRPPSLWHSAAQYHLRSDVCLRNVPADRPPLHLRIFPHHSADAMRQFLSIPPTSHATADP